MSKQSEAKEKQNYRSKPDTCGNCAHFTSTRETKLSPWDGTEWIEEKNLRCGLGGFKVGKSGTCDEHQRKAGEL